MDEDWYLGARGIKFWRHPGAHLSKKPGRWLIAAELVETTRLYGRGLAAIDPQWIAAIAGHLLKTQLLEPHWEKKCGEVVALERASLYGIVVYNDRRVNFGHVDPAAARALFIRHALVEGDWDSKMEFLAHNRKLVAQVQELEHKSRRQDVLVDDSLIHAFYEQQIPADVNTGAGLESWYREEVKRQPQLLRLTRDELMRHEAAGITTAAFPKVVRLGGIDSAATYLHQPGDARDGLTVTVPIYALNQVSDERCEWLVPGLLKEKVIALLKTLPGKPRARLLPLPEWADGFVARTDFADGSLIDRLQAAVRSHTGLEVKRADFKTDTLGAHLFMNLRVVDEDGRQLGMGRHVAALKAELGSRARNAFQALANLKRPVAAAESGAATTAAPPGAGPLAQQRYAEWTFGELPELMELRSGNQTLVGFPALVDKNTHVELEVFDEPEAASEKHRAGLRRLVALAMRDALKALERNIPDLQRMAVLYTQVERASEGSGGGGADELRDQIVALALDRAFLAEPLPTDSVSFKRRVDEGRSRLNLIAQEVARLTAGVLDEFANATRKLKDSRPPKDVAEDISAQLQRLCPKRFIVLTPYVQLQHLPRYLKAVTLRLDKLRTDPARDAQRLGELRPLEQRYVRRLAELKGARDARLEEYRWLLEELRVSLFAQELRTPQPVSVKRLERAWQQLSS